MSSNIVQFQICCHLAKFTQHNHLAKFIANIVQAGQSPTLSTSQSLNTATLKKFMCIQRATQPCSISAISGLQRRPCAGGSGQRARRVEEAARPWAAVVLGGGRQFVGGSGMRRRLLVRQWRRHMEEPGRGRWQRSEEAARPLAAAAHGGGHSSVSSSGTWRRPAAAARGRARLWPKFVGVRERGERGAGRGELHFHLFSAVNEKTHRIYYYIRRMWVGQSRRNYALFSLVYG
jgi:hypothetical protein